MHTTPELLAGTTIDWQRLHRTTRIELGEKLIGRKIAYRTYSMLTEPGEKGEAKRMRVDDIDDTERRGKGRMRTFLGYNDDNVFIILPWSRIVEVTLL